MKFCPPRNLAAIGMLYATYCPTIIMEKIAPIAAAPAKARSVRSNAAIAVNHTALTGVCVRVLMLYMMRERGRPPSRANAKVCRELAVSYIMEVKSIVLDFYCSDFLTMLTPIINLPYKY